MNAETRLEIFKRFKAHDSDPVTELIYNSDFELLVAVMLSAQATDVSVNKATPALFEVANTPQAILGLGEERVKEYLKTLNYFNTKAKHLVKASKILVDQFDGRVPSKRAELESLPGVGRKTANVVLNVLFDHPTIAVDTHIFRVANRTGLSKGKTPLLVEKALEKNTPTAYLHQAHHWLVLHGRYVCLARKPRCSECFISDLCEFPDKV